MLIYTIEMWKKKYSEAANLHANTFGHAYISLVPDKWIYTKFRKLLGNFEWKYRQNQN